MQLFHGGFRIQSMQRVGTVVAIDDISQPRVSQDVRRRFERVSLQ